MDAITVGAAKDPARYVASNDFVWAGEPDPRPAEEQVRGLPPDERRTAEVADTPLSLYAGVYGVYPMRLAVPGPYGGPAPLLDIAGLTWVGVHPDVRRRGVLTAMIDDHLRRCRQAGLAVSALHASEPAIYGRFGYGLASLELRLTLAHDHRLEAPGLDDAAAELETRTLTATDPGVPDRVQACIAAVAARSHGTVVGGRELYRGRFDPPPADRRGQERHRVLVAVRDGVDVGLAWYRRRPRWEAERPGGTVEVRDLYGDPAARLALLRRLVRLDLMSSVVVPQLAVDDPLLQWVGGPRGASAAELYDSLWVRLVDVPACDLSRDARQPDPRFVGSAVVHFGGLVGLLGAPVGW